MSCNWFVGSWPPFITGLIYDDPPLPVASELPIKTLVARQPSTNTQTYAYTHISPITMPSCSCTRALWSLVIPCHPCQGSLAPRTSNTWESALMRLHAHNPILPVLGDQSSAHIHLVTHIHLSSLEDSWVGLIYFSMKSFGHIVLAIDVSWSLAIPCHPV